MILFLVLSGRNTSLPCVKRSKWLGDMGIKDCSECGKTHRSDLACKDTLPLIVVLGKNRYYEIFGLGMTIRAENELKRTRESDATV